MANPAPCRREVEITMAQQPMAVRRMYTQAEMMRAAALGALAATIACTALIVGVHYLAHVLFS